MKYEIVIGVQNAPDFFIEFDDEEEFKRKLTTVKSDYKNGKEIYLTHAKSRLQSLFKTVTIPNSHVTYIGTKEK